MKQKIKKDDALFDELVKQEEKKRIALLKRIADSQHLSQKQRIEEQQKRLKDAKLIKQWRNREFLKSKVKIDDAMFTKLMNDEE